MLLVIGLGYCHPAERSYFPIAMAAADVFHQRLARGEDELIYREAANSFRAMVSEDAEHAFLSRVRQKLGACSSRDPVAWGAATNSGGTEVRLTYRNECTNGPVQELFLWHVLNNQATLMGFRAEW